jgi:tetratricopeptide (TPR) repeat protein
VTGTDIEEATAENLAPGRGDRMVNLVLHRKGSATKAKKEASAVAISRLRIPRNARKNLDRGNAALAAGKTAEAEAAFQEAIRAYPDFDQAYNNLGVAMMRSGDEAGGKAAFEKAVQINPHFARALSNLAKIALEDRKFSEGLDLIRKSLATEPLNPPSLLYGVELAYFAGNYQEAISYTRTMHSLQHSGMGLVHYLCAMSFEKLNMPSQALAEYQLFVQEDPQDPNVGQAQMAIAAIRAAGR